VSTSAVSRASLSIAFAALIPAIAGCGIVGPSCNDETASVFSVSGQVAPDGVASYSVTSPKNSNLVIRLTWPDTTTTLGLKATITDCGGHTGCSMITMTPTFGPGGSSPVPQPWPPGLREMRVDGWKGKSYRVDVTGDGARDASFTLDVSYRITCER